MEIVLFLLPFVVLGVGVLFVAFSGGPGRAREAYLTGGNRGFRVAIPLIYILLGVGVPVAVIVSRGEAEGGTDKLETVELSDQQEEGKDLFKTTCASCHNLDAVNARGVTGPDLDEIGEVTPERIRNAIENGGTGQNRMPSNLLRGAEAEAVAAYVAAVAGK
jgi:cytochrome c553